MASLVLHVRPYHFSGSILCHIPRPRARVSGNVGFTLDDIISVEAFNFIHLGSARRVRSGNTFDRIISVGVVSFIRTKGQRTHK